MLNRRSPFAPLVAYAAVLVLVALVTLVLPATGAIGVPVLPVGAEDVREAQVVEVISDERTESQRGNVRHQVLLVAVGGEQVQIENVVVEGGAGGYTFEAGDHILVSSSDVTGETRYLIQDRARRAPVWMLSLAFAVLVVAVGGRQGALSLGALAISFLVIVRFIVPAIFSGWDPVLTAILGSLVIMSAALVIGHGPSVKTWIALAGTAGSLALTGALAAVAVGATRLSGFGDEDAATLSFLTGDIDAGALLLGGIIIGALGVLDDVTSTQASTVVELRRANPALGARQLFGRAMNVGRDHIAATTNTLLLAYAGASLPLLMILAGQSQPLGILVSYEQLTTEIVRTLAGSIGIVAAVPITTALAALVLGAGFLDAPEPVRPALVEEYRTGRAAD
ncbi:MAG: YibE/F family protein [Dehalococcoidia bacterium]|nr:YibE/F family protein [Dehalococcoidia bacterium]